MRICIGGRVLVASGWKRRLVVLFGHRDDFPVFIQMDPHQGVRHLRSCVHERSRAQAQSVARNQWIGLADVDRDVINLSSGLAGSTRVSMDLITN